MSSKHKMNGIHKLRHDIQIQDFTNPISEGRGLAKMGKKTHMTEVRVGY